MGKEAENTEVSTTKLDLAVRDYSEARREYEEAKAVSNDKHATMEDKEAFMMSLLEQAGKSKYHVDGIGTVQVIDKLVVKVPQDMTAKGKFFSWLNKTMGADGFLTYVSVNHQTLNSLYKEQFELAENKAAFAIEGIDQPTVRKELRLKRA